MTGLGLTSVSCSVLLAKGPAMLVPAARTRGCSLEDQRIPDDAVWISIRKHAGMGQRKIVQGVGLCAI